MVRTTASHTSIISAGMGNRWNRYTLFLWKHLWKRKHLNAGFGQCYILESQYGTVQLCYVLRTEPWLKTGKKSFPYVSFLPQRVWTAYFRVTSLSHIWKGKKIHTVAQEPETFCFESFSSCASLAHLTFPEIAFFLIEKKVYNSRLELATFKKQHQTHLEVFKKNLL